jgi:hypothetical protein
MGATTWNSLEVAKLAAAIATPLAVVLIGIFVNARVKRLEDAQWTHRTLIERRMKIYDDMATPLNDLLVFFRLFGHFRDVTPPDAVELKRTLDKTFQPNRSLFSEDFGGRYDRFIAACFDMYQAGGGAARLRASRSRQRVERGKWDGAWDRHFVNESFPVIPNGAALARPPKDPQGTIVEALYWRLMHAFAHELTMVDRPLRRTRRFQGSVADVDDDDDELWEYEPGQPVQVRDGTDWLDGVLVEYEETTRDRGADAKAATRRDAWVRRVCDGKVRRFRPSDIRAAPNPERKGSRW